LFLSPLLLHGEIAVFTQPAAVYRLHARLTKSIDATDKKTREPVSGIFAAVSQFEVERAVVELRAARVAQTSAPGQTMRALYQLTVSMPEPGKRRPASGRTSVHP